MVSCVELSSPCLQINALKEGGFGWLLEMLECFNSGTGILDGAAATQLHVLFFFQMPRPLLTPITTPA